MKPVLCDHSKQKTKIGFQDRFSLNAGQKYDRMLQGLQYFRHSLRYHLSIFEWWLKTSYTGERVKKGADQTARMCRLAGTFVVLIQQYHGFTWRR